MEKQAEMLKLIVTLAAAFIMFYVTWFVGKMTIDAGWNDVAVKQACMASIVSMGSIGLVAMILVFRGINKRRSL